MSSLLHRSTLFVFEQTFLKHKKDRKYFFCAFPFLADTVPSLWTWHFPARRSNAVRHWKFHHKMITVRQPLASYWRSDYAKSARATATNVPSSDKLFYSAPSGRKNTKPHICVMFLTNICRDKSVGRRVGGFCRSSIRAPSQPSAAEW